MSGVKKMMKLSPARLITLGILAVVLVGSVLLSLPFAAKDGARVSYLDALFTSVSASCVTGLITVDTYSTWSLFGQIVIICLIQVGGLGLMTFITMFSVFLKRKIGLGERKLLMEAAGAMSIGGTVRLVKSIVKGTFLFEGIGAALLATRFCPRMGFVRGLYNAVFHSVSAFCNAGFDLMGASEPFSSFTGEFAFDPIVNLTLSALIVIGGLGFIVWNDIAKCGIRFSKYEVHSKIVLTTTAVLLIGGAALYFVLEYGAAFEGLDVGQRILASVFQSATMRTAGFNTVDLSGLSEGGNILSYVLMLIGGSPGSTAGGIKTTTVAVMLLGAVSASKNQSEITAFRRRLQDGVMKQAAAIFMIYLSAAVVFTVVLCCLEGIEAKAAAFEVTSAIGTVGLSLGLTPTLGVTSKIIVMILMFGGRIGGLTFMLSLAGKGQELPVKRPEQRILIG